MNEMDMMLDLIALACGIYCLYTWLKLVITKKLFPNGLLVPKDKSVKDCLDEEGYIAYISPRLGVLAIFTTVYGAFFTLNDNLAQPILAYPWNLAPLVVVIGVLVWYAVCNGKANKDYFGM